jgi:tetratricopeptide (TPR) repeat protein
MAPTARMRCLNKTPMQRRAAIAVGLLACLPLGLLPGCAPKKPSPQLLADVAKAESLQREGCYTCLKESLAMFDKIRQAKIQPAGVAEKAFDTALLIAVREKELGIPSDEAIARARSLLVPSRQPVFDAAELIIGDASGLDPEMRALVTGRNRPALEPDNPRRRALDAYPETDQAAKYVALAIDCEQQKLIESLDMKALAATYSGSPLIQFRLSICGRPFAPNVGALRQSNPRWTDTLYWEARREMVASLGQAIDLSKVIGLYGQGREAFPASLMLTMAWSMANLTAEEFEAALSGFEDVLKTFPTHRDAMNGKMQAQSYLMRHQDAIATATRILELGTWNIPDANYWRAWNRYQIKEYDAAWVDVENAVKGISNSRVYMLAGLIAYSRKQLQVAVDRFDTAFAADAGACDAVWMSGLVSIDMDQLGIAAPKFARSMTCFVSAASGLRQAREQLDMNLKKRGTPPTARDQRNLDRLERDADTAELKSAQSAFNGAQCYARTGGKGLALNLVDAAIAHPEMREKAIALKAAIEKLPN